MELRKAVISLLFVLLFSALALSQTVVRESFDHPVTIDKLGAAADGWAGSWAIDAADNGVEGRAVLAGNFFNYDALNWVLPYVGNHLAISRKAAWADHQRYKRVLATPFANEAGKQLWVSYLMDVQEPLPLGNAYFMVKLFSDGSEIMAIGKGGGRDANAPVFTCGSGWPGSSGDDVSNVEITAGPVWLVVRIDLSGGADPCRTFMWVDPDPTVEPDTMAAAVKRNSTIPGPVNTVGVEFGGDTAGGLIVFDEIRLASGFADLTAETPANPVMKESFDYPNSINAAGAAADGWAGSWAIDAADNGVEGRAVLAGNLFNYDALNWVLPYVGNHLAISRKAAWADHQRYKRVLATPFANEAGKQLWVSYLMDVQEPLPLGNAYFMVKLFSDASEIMAIGKGGGRDANAPVFTCGSGWPGGSGDDVSNVEITAGPVWLVVRIDLSGGADPCRTFMWVDPDPTVEPDTMAAAVKRNSTIPGPVNTVGIEFGGDTAGGLIVFDEIRLASGFADLSSEITSVEENGVRPQEFSLTQNYPNPFNPATRITYSLQSTGQVRLAVYDLLGREVAVLVDRVQGAGSHTQLFSGAGLPSGLYFYRLQTAAGTITRKMALTK